MNGWQFVIHQEALEAIDALSSSERREIRKALRRWLMTPIKCRMRRFELPNDRIYLVKRVQSYYVVYWLDAFVREVRIVRLDSPR